MKEAVQFKLIDLKEQIVTKTFFAEIQLHDTHIRFRIKAIVDDYSETTACWNRGVGCHHDVVLKRKHAVAAELSFTDTKKWRVRISANGVEDDLNIYFENFAEATSLHEKLIKYITE